MNHNSDNSPSCWCYSENGVTVSTFIPKVLTVTQIKYPTETLTILRLRLSLADNQSVECDVRLNDIDHVRWTDIDYRCFLNTACNKASQIIATMIKESAYNVPIITKYGFDHVGITKIANEIFYVAGNRLFTQSQNKISADSYVLEDLGLKLDIDPNITALEAYHGMVELVNLSPGVGSVLVTYVIAGILTTAFKEVGFKPSTILMVVGKSGMLKSHYVPQMAQLYNRESGIKPDTRFNSTMRFIEDIFCQYSDCTLIVDDLHTAESSRIKKLNETTAEEIARRISDDTGRGCMNGKRTVQKSFNGNAIFIGEYTVGEQSTTARFLVVNMTQKPDGTVLDKYTREKKLLMSTFYSHFIQWYVDNYADICYSISEGIEKFRSQNKNADIHGRLLDTYMYLSISYKILLEYFMKSEFISIEEYRKDNIIFNNIVSRLVKEQQSRYESVNEGSEGERYLKTIKKLCNAPNGFRISKNRKKYDKDKHDGLFNKECLCIRGNSIDTIMSKHTKNYSRQRFTKALKRINALKLDGEGKQSQIGNERFYCIYMSMLQ